MGESVLHRALEGLVDGPVITGQRQRIVEATGNEVLAAFETGDRQITLAFVLFVSALCLRM
jgi:hypothetical protein